MDHFKLNSKDTSDFDTFHLQMLSTESTAFFPAAAQFSRVERTLMVADYPKSYHRLDVCTNPPMDSPFINCSTCYKCLRTQLTLEMAGKLKEYDKVFDLEAYRREKEKYIGSLLARSKKSVLDVEVLDYMNKRGYKPSIKTYLYLTKSWWSLYKINSKKKLKKQLAGLKE